MARLFPSGVRPALVIKLAAAAALVVIADVFVFGGRGIGWTLGGFALAFAVAFAAVQPAAIRDRRALKFLTLACLMAGVVAARPTFAGWFLFGCFIGMASLSPRAGPADDAWRWFQRLAWQPICGSAGPLIDLARLSKPKMKAHLDRKPGRLPFLKVLPMLALPALGALLFLGLFAAANPIIADALSNIDTGRLDLVRFVFWGFVFVVVWAVLRPRFLRRPMATPGARGDARIPGVSLASVILSLVTFNALFAVQNGLDIAFLWSGQRLPEQFTLAEYVHAGVYPLMASAVATAIFVLVALRPGSAIAAHRLVRALVVLWVAQNLFVVASSAYRMVLYVESFSLTRIRILVLIWMVLVAVGLASILWRMLKDRASGWLLNVNARAALLAIFALAVVDIGQVAATWNVRNAREMGGTGVELDVCYLGELGDAAVLPLIEAEARPDLPASLRNRLAWTRARAHADLAGRQDHWSTWTPVGAWRMAGAGPLAAAEGSADADCRSPARRAADLAREEAMYGGPAPKAETDPAVAPAPTADAPPVAPPDSRPSTAAAGPAPSPTPSPQTDDPSLTSEPQSR